jgi:arylsulfatase
MNGKGRIGRTVDESVPFEGLDKPARRKYPNVVIWVLDDVGYGDLSPYGGLVDMPVMQSLVQRGVRFDNAHVTPLCTPTRACLLTGRNHHSNHMPAVPRWAANLSFPVFDCRIPRENGFLSEILLDQGFATFCVGKWHLTSIEDLSPGASRDAWPLGRGFERFYGFMAGQTSQFSPHLVVDNHSVLRHEPFPEDYHLSEDMVDKAIRYIHELRSADSEKPFFLYLAFGAGHAPHHAPRDWIDRFKGRFDMGWDRYREIVHARQIEMGIFPEDSPLSQRDPDVPRWDGLDDKQKKIYCRYMEAFAGMTAHMDAQVGRLLAVLADLGELDNTIILAVSDNGASSEGGAFGSFNNQQWQGRGSSVDSKQISTEYSDIDLIGGPLSYNHYPWGWAWAGNTPFRRWKRETYRGGCAVPFVLSWPEGIAGRGERRNQFIHGIDVLPTLLDLLEISPSERIAGIQQSPIEGKSFAGCIQDADRPTDHLTQYFECIGHRSIFHDGWRAVCPWPGPSFDGAEKKWPAEITAQDLDRVEEEGWELYHVAIDPAESRNLASEESERLRRMINLWWQEAGKYGVLPIAGRPGRPAPEDALKALPRRHVYFPDTAPVFIENAANVINADYSISANMDIRSGSDAGMLLAHGGRFGGYGFLIRSGKPCFVYNCLGISQIEIEAPNPLSPGPHQVIFRFTTDGPPDFNAGWGAPGEGELLVDDEVVATGRIEQTAPVMLSFSGMLTCGYHPAEPFLDYPLPFRFTGKLKRVTVEIKNSAAPNADAERTVFMRRQ